MSREKANTKQKCEPKNIKGDSILAGDKEFARRYIEWKQLMDKYNHIDENDDGMSIEDALEQYQQEDAESKNTEQPQEEALECSEDDEVVANSKGDYAALKNQLTTALKERSTEWKNNGMEEIFNSDFSLSVDYVQRWLEDCEHGTGKQITQERETRFTEYNGTSQMDVTHRENISILNHTDRKKLATAHSSNYEFCGTDQRRVIIHHVEKTTISSFLTVDTHERNGATGGAIPKLPLDNFFGNISAFTPFKLPHHVGTQRSTTCGKDRIEKNLQGVRTINSSTFDSASLISLMENSLKIVPKMRVESAIQNKLLKPKPKRRVNFKPSKKKRQMISDSSESSDSDENYTPDDSDEELRERVSKPTRSVPVVCVSKKKQPTAYISLCSDSSEDSLCETKAPSPIKSLPADISSNRVNETNASLTNGLNHPGNKKLPKDQQQPSLTQNARKYPMPANYRQMLSVNGRCRYKTDGTIIYRPKPIHAGLPKDAGNILIKTEDLDLSGIKSNLRRKKFDNFSRQTHPNSVLVYYMSDSDDELSDRLQARDSGEDSSDDDDPILSFRPQLCVLTFFNDDTQTS